MNEGQYIAIRNYLEEIASNQKQILAELRRVNSTPVAERPSATTRPAVTEPIPVTLEAPWDDYDDMTVADVLAKAEQVNAPTRQKALAYERQNKKRTGVIDKLVNWNS